MNHRTNIIIGLVVTLLAGPTLAQSAPVAPNPLGVWRGTSTCLIRPSACHDEIVVYRITHGSVRDSLALDGRKIVNGQEVEMGVLGCRVAQPGAQVICVIPSGVWRFTVSGDSLVGELRLSDNTKSRDVRAARSR
jgi:hypothetical protein